MQLDMGQYQQQRVTTRLVQDMSILQMSTAELEEYPLTIAPYDAAVIVSDPENCVPVKTYGTPAGSIPLEQFKLELYEIGNDKLRLRPEFTLRPVSQVDRDFSGTMVYTATFHLDKVPASAVFSAQYVYECMTVTVNGKTFAPVIVPPYEQDVSEALQAGENEIVISVANTPLRNANTKPGPFGKARVALEPSGMFGNVEIKLFD